MEKILKTMGVCMFLMGCGGRPYELESLSDSGIEADGGTSTDINSDTDTDSGTKCPEGETRCQNNIIQKCQLETWKDWTDCLALGKMCTPIDGKAVCTGGGDGDTDADSDTDSDTDTDTDSGTDSGTLCTPTAYQQCGSGGDVHWFDSCGIEGGVTSNCMACETCNNTSNIAAVCITYCKLDPNTNLYWQEPKASTQYQWKPAIDYCNGLSLGGHDDWVLPTRQNFIDILGGCDTNVLAGDNGFCNSCANSATCTALFGSDTHTYWTSSPYYDNTPPVGFSVYFNDSFISDTPPHSYQDVRCVRSEL